MGNQTTTQSSAYCCLLGSSREHSSPFFLAEGVNLEANPCPRSPLLLLLMVVVVVVVVVGRLLLLLLPLLRLRLQLSLSLWLSLGVVSARFGSKSSRGNQCNSPK